MSALEVSPRAERLLNESQAAEFLGMAASTLATWRCRKRYSLPYVKLGRSVRYRESELTQWLDSRQRESLSEEGAQ